MKFTDDRPLSDPDTAARKLVEFANAAHADKLQRIYIEFINRPFLQAGGTPEEYRVGLVRAVDKGWLVRDMSGGHVKFTQAGADLFA